MATAFGLKRRVGGVLAAYLVVLQAVLAGLALGATPVAADPFTVLCRPGASQQAPDAPKKHHALPDCCVTGCVMLSGGMAPPETAVAPLQTREIDTAAPVAGTDVPPRSDARTPRNPRAPPAWT